MDCAGYEHSLRAGEPGVTGSGSLSSVSPGTVCATPCASGFALD